MPYGYSLETGLNNALTNNNPFESVARLKTRYDLAGVPAPEPKGSGIGNMLMGVLDIIDRPRNAVVGLLSEGSPTGLWKGFTGQDKYSVSDLIYKSGISNGFVRGVGGFVGDVLLDPTTYLGGTGLLKKGGILAGKAVSSAFGKSAIGNTARYLTDKLTQSLAKQGIEMTAEQAVGRIGKNLDDVLKTADNLGIEASQAGFKEYQTATRAGQTAVNENLAQQSEFANRLMGQLFPKSNIGVEDVSKLLPDLAKPTDVAMRKQFYSQYGRLAINNMRKAGLKDDQVNAVVRLSNAFTTEVADINTLQKAAIKLTKTKEDLIPDLVGRLDRFSNKYVNKAFNKMPAEYKEQLLRNMYAQGKTFDKLGLDDFKNTFEELISSGNKGLQQHYDNLLKAVEDKTAVWASKVKEPIADRVRATAQAFSKAKSDHLDKMIEITYANGLVDVVDDLAKRRYITFMGKPLVDITPALEQGKKVLDNAYINNFLGFQKVSDATRKMFSTGLTRFGEMLPEAPILGQAIDKLKNFKMGMHSIPSRVQEFVVRGLGREFLEDGVVDNLDKTVLNQASLYMREALQEDADDMAVEAWDKMLNAGNNGKPLTPNQLDYVNRLSAKMDIQNHTLFQFDKVLGEDYDEMLNYVHHVYDFEGTQISTRDFIKFAQAQAKALKGEAVEFTQEELANRPIMERFAKLILGVNDNAGLNSALTMAFSPSQMQKFSLARAQKAGLTPITDPAILQALRAAETMRLAYKINLVNGLPDLYSKLGSKVFNTDKIDEMAEAYANTVQPSDTYEMLKAEGKSALMGSLDSLVRGLGDDGIKALSEVVSTKPKLGFKPITGVDRLQGVYVHPELVHHFERLDNIFFNDDTFNGILGVWDGITRGLKTLQTTLNPSFHIKNPIGEFVMNAVDGVTDPETYKKTFDVMRNMYTTSSINSRKYYNTEAIELLKHIPNPDTIITFNGQKMKARVAMDNLLQNRLIETAPGVKMSIDDLMAEFVSRGLSHSGMTRDTLKDSMPSIIAHTFGEEGSRKMLKSELKSSDWKVKASALPRYGLERLQAFGDKSDTFFRLSHFLGALGRGETFDQAARTVKQFHVDYGDLTRVEQQVFRRIVPYYTYMRKNIPIQFRLLLEKPGIYTALGHVVDNAYSALGNPETADYLEEGMAIPIFEDGEGNINYLNLNLPLADLAKIKTSIEGSSREMYSSINPLFIFKVVPDLLSGQNISLGTPITDPSQYIMSSLGTAGQVMKYVDSAMESPNPDTPQELIQPQSYPGLGVWARKNPRKEQVAKAYKYRDELMADMQKLKKEGQPIPTYEELDSNSMTYKQAVAKYRREINKMTKPSKTKRNDYAGDPIYEGNKREYKYTP